MMLLMQEQVERLLYVKEQKLPDELLFAQLTGADAGGTWSGPVDGAYTYTLEATQCTCTEDDSATVTVSFDAAPDAGTSTTLTVCEGTEITR